MNRILAILLLAVTVSTVAQKNLQFIGEKIDFKIDEERFSINGIYYFANSTDKTIKQTILFPFSEKGESLVVKRVNNLSYSENLGFQKMKSAIAFKILIQANDTVKVNINYSQKTTKENVYVLKSTQAWGKALQRADYTLDVAKSIHIDSLSLKADSVSNGMYYWNKINFYPNEDFKVWIK